MNKNVFFEKWNDILEHIRKEHDLFDLFLETWLLTLKVHSIQDNIIRIIVPVDEMVVYLNAKFRIPLYVAVAEFTGEKYEIVFITKKQAKELDLNTAHLVKDAPGANPAYAVNLKKANINAKYTFDNFVEGNNNKFALAASMRMAETPRKIDSPLFLYGGAKVGKTHLMHAIANYILSINSDMKVLYVTGECFTNELIETLCVDTFTNMTRFREKYRNLDVLLIDDVQFIAGKEIIQEEFFHIFNFLHNADKRIIISSDRPPKDIQTLEERLRTQFECGLIADISSPDFETCMAILRKKKGGSDEDDKFALSKV